VTTDMAGEELSADDAWHSIRRHGLRRLLVESFVRFRYGDGFTNSRALAFQIALGVVPFMIGLTGLAADLDVDQPSRVLASTVAAVAPGAGDVLGNALDPGAAADRAGELALAFGLVFALASMTTAMAQVERGANRIYGIDRDRPALYKYGRAVVLTAVLAGPVGAGFLLLVAGGPFGDAMQAVYGWSDAADRAWDVLRWPAGLVLTTFAIAVLLDHVPRRRQPALSWLALGSGTAVAITMIASVLLNLYVRFSGSFGDVYGPLAGIIALLLWCYLTSIALFAGTALAAQLEALRAGLVAPIVEDPGPATATPPTEGAR
jgi:YihY family inner membrane protein